jgi:hypothetical protein
MCRAVPPLFDAKKGGGNQVFKFIGAKAFPQGRRVAGQVRRCDRHSHSERRYRRQRHGNGKADFQIEVHSLNALLKVDFIL